MKRAKSKAKQYVDKNPIEQLLGGFDQILGSAGTEESRKKDQGILIEGQEVNLAELHGKKPQMQEEKETPYVEASIDYARDVIHVAEKSVSHEKRELEEQLKEIMAEIKKLTDSSKDLQMQFKTVAVEQHVVKPGKYHKTFFSWLLSVIRSARMKVEDSGAWLAAMHSKKKSREYGAMMKKHGTSFSLSNERNVSTQVG